MRYENGAIGSVEGSRFATGRKNYNRFEIGNGSKGSLVFDLERMNELELYVEEGKVQRVSQDNPGDRCEASRTPAPGGPPVTSWATTHVHAYRAPI